MKQTEIIKLLLKDSIKANKKDEVPVSCIITFNDKIIAKKINKKNKNRSCINHAEILCIQKAQKKMHDWRLNECEMYVTLKPCNMCEQVIIESRIKKVYYLLDSNYNQNRYCKTKFIQLNEYEQYQKEYKRILQDFFKRKR